MNSSLLFEAIALLASGDRETYMIILRTLTVSGSATILASLFGIPWGFWLSTRRGFWVRLTNALMGIPPVLLGLLVYLLLSREGPLGQAGLLFTPTAMILAQWLLVTPVVAGVSRQALVQARSRLCPLLLALGAGQRQTAWEILREAQPGLLLAIATGLGRALGEVGAVMLVGGNIRGSTRVLTTAIVLETRQGNYASAVALGLVLLLLSLILNFLLDLWRNKEGQNNA